MTNRELNLCQMMTTIWERSLEVAEQLDPLRDRNNPIAVKMDRIAELASEAFRLATGRSPRDVKTCADLNNTTPREPWRSIKWQCDD